MKLTKVLIVLLALPAALSVSTSALAGHWDSTGSKPSHNRNSSSIRYSLPAQNYRHNNRASQHQRTRQNSSVNIIVGNVPSIGRWSSPYNSPRNRARSNIYSGVVFNSSLGFISSGVVNQLSRQQSHHNDYRNDTYYSDDYYQSSRVIRHEEVHKSITYLKDINGRCFEKEVDRYGRTIKTRVADYNCRF